MTSTTRAPACASPTPSQASCALATACAALAVRMGGDLPPLPLATLSSSLTNTLCFLCPLHARLSPDTCPDAPCSLTYPCYYSGDPYALDNSWCPPPVGPLPASSSTSTAPNSNVSMCPKGGRLGSGTATGKPCPGGTFNAKENQTLPTDCTPCAIGTYGGKQAWSFPSCEYSCPTGRCALFGRAACTACPPRRPLLTHSSFPFSHTYPLLTPSRQCKRNADSGQRLQALQQRQVHLQHGRH